MIDLQKLADSYYIERDQNYVRFKKFNFEYYIKGIKRYIEDVILLSGFVGCIIGAILTMIIFYYLGYNN